MEKLKALNLLEKHLNLISDEKGFYFDAIVNAIIEALEVSKPTEEEINEMVEKYSFAVPYDGTTDFYDRVAAKHFREGIRTILKYQSNDNTNTK